MDLAKRIAKRGVAAAVGYAFVAGVVALWPCALAQTKAPQTRQKIIVSNISRRCWPSGVVMMKTSGGSMSKKSARIVP
jgi:uncharacterized membrane protein